MSLPRIDMEDALVRSIANGVTVPASGTAEGFFRMLRRDRSGALRNAAADVAGRRIPVVADLIEAGWLAPSDDGTFAPTTAFLAAIDAHDEDRAPLYYSLQPVHAPRRGEHLSIASAAVVNCIATGRILSGCGGPGYGLATDIVHALDMRRSGGAPKVVLDAADFDRMSRALSDAGDALAATSDGPGSRDALAAVKAALAAIAPDAA